MTAREFNFTAGHGLISTLPSRLEARHSVEDTLCRFNAVVWLYQNWQTEFAREEWVHLDVITLPELNAGSADKTGHTSSKANSHN